MSEKLKSVFDPVNARLENIYNEVFKAQGFTAETEKLRLLLELAKEQVQNEDLNSSTSTPG